MIYHVSKNGSDFSCGSKIDFAKDYFGNTRKDVFKPGPFAELKHDKQSITIWE